MTSLREKRIEGVRTPSGRVLLPPSEYDPETGEAIVDWVTVGPKGVVKSWCWVPEPGPNVPYEQAFAWALIQLDGADTSFVHGICGPETALHTGARVQAVWAEKRVGSILDIRWFEVI